MPKTIKYTVSRCHNGCHWHQAPRQRRPCFVQFYKTSTDTTVGCDDLTATLGHSV